MLQRMANTPKTLVLPPKLLTSLEALAKLWNIRTAGYSWSSKYTRRPKDFGNGWTDATWASVLRYAGEKLVAEKKATKKPAKKAAKKTAKRKAKKKVRR